MSHNRKIISSIQKIAGTFKEDKVSIYLAEVKSIEGNTCTCYIEDDVEVPNCQLQASVCDGLLIVPTIGSNVVIMTSIKNDNYVVQYSDIDSYYLQVGDGSIEILNDGSITLNDGSFGGLIKIIELVTKLNNIENLVNDLVAKYNTHTHLVSSVGSPTAPTTTTETNTLTPTQQADIENTKITQGI
jgi:hypothetical protein